MTINDIENAGYRSHHSAVRKNYTRVAERNIPRPYNGRFGTGYVVSLGPVIRDGKASTQYEGIAYYIKKIKK